jgi:hypothetical protein
MGHCEHRAVRAAELCWAEVLVGKEEHNIDIEALYQGLDPVDWVQLWLTARLSPGQRILAGMQARAFVVASLRGTFRRRFPDLSQAELNMKVLAYLTPVRMPWAEKGE